MRDDSSPPSKTNRLYIIFWTIVAALVAIYSMALVVIEWGIVGETDFQDSRPEIQKEEGPWSVTDTLPTAELSDAQFGVLVGFTLWITTEIAGLGLEYFVWHHLLQIWDDKREALWKFAQFLFPLLVGTTIGLALDRNFLALPFLVVSMWKFGYPETIMYLYLGLFDKKSARLRRISDFVNGVGTVAHHSAAAFLVCMLLAGVIPPSRYVLNSSLILVVQHWFVLLSYINETAYVVVELALEAWFEWTVISDFYHIRSLHWTAALGTGIFVFAHWLYLLAAGLDMLVDKTSIDADNVHQRGTKAFRRRSTNVVSQHVRAHSTLAWDALEAMNELEHEA